MVLVENERLLKELIESRRLLPLKSGKKKNNMCNHIKGTDEVLFDENPPPNPSGTGQVSLID